MADKTFLDTNVIVYAYDTSAGEKHERAKGLLMDLWDSGCGVISVQVLQEFYVTVTQKIPRPSVRGHPRRQDQRHPDHQSLPQSRRGRIAPLGD